MANKASEYAGEILRLRAEGESVRSIATKLGLPASSVHHLLKQENGNDESKESASFDPAPILDAVNNVALRLDELSKEVKEIGQVYWTREQDKLGLFDILHNPKADAQL